MAGVPGLGLPAAPSIRLSATPEEFLTPGVAAYNAAAMTQKPRVALFVTCLVDLHRPSVGFAAVKLIEEAGAEVFVPAAQTCCGQPAYNGG
ncbi:heterodisulfide reductase-related iron-sulfur binding cluster, partial [Acinetobacter baumannii]